VWWYQMLYNTVLTSWWWAQQCSKHVEEYNKLIIKQDFVHSLSTCAPDGHLQVWWYQMLYNAILTSWWWAQQCLKHVQAYNKLIIKQYFVHSFSTCAPDGQLQVWRYQMLFNTILTAWWWAQQCSKHVEAYNKLIIKQDFVH